MYHMLLGELISWKKNLGPKKAFFQIENAQVTVLLLNQISKEKSCSKTKLCQQKPSFEFKMFE